MRHPCVPVHSGRVVILFANPWGLRWGSGRGPPRCSPLSCPEPPPPASLGPICSPPDLHGSHSCGGVSRAVLARACVGGGGGRQAGGGQCGPQEHRPRRGGRVRGCAGGRRGVQGCRVDSGRHRGQSLRLPLAPLGTWLFVRGTRITFLDAWRLSRLGGGMDRVGQDDVTMMMMMMGGKM